MGKPRGVETGAAGDDRPDIATNDDDLAVQQPADVHPDGSGHGQYAGGRAAYVAGLRTELAGYLAQGRDGRAADVAAELERLGETV